MRRFFSVLAALPGLFAPAQQVGGQAVMEGVMMRCKSRLAIAVRKPDGSISVASRPWFSLTDRPILKRPFVRGFPVLIETLVNGVSALNFSAREALDEDEGEITPLAMGLTVAASLGFALALFVVAPHLFSLGMKWLGVSGGVETLSFHVWDGVFKLALFVGYIVAISFVPDIRRVFQYHGAEHKTIWAFEKGSDLTPAGVRGYSRLHPRCGTTFLLFVLAVSIVLYAFLVPWLLTFWAPAHAWVKQAYIILVKFLLMIPVSAMSYELIKFLGKHEGNVLCKAMSCPGMAMQMLTTHEPDDAQIEVAIEALKKAVENQEKG